MPKITTPLNAKTVAAAFCPAGQTIKKLSDGGSGLTLEVRRQTRTWVFNFQFAGSPRKFTLGKYPTTSLADARYKALAARKLVEDGIDPVGNRRAAEAAAVAEIENAFAKVFVRWYAVWKSGKTPRHADYVLARAQADVLPQFGAMPIEKITTPIILRTIRKMEARGVNELARRVLGMISQIFDFACVEGIVSSNPATPIKPSKHLRKKTVQNMPRVSEKELPDLLRKMWGYDEGRGRELTGLALRLLALTFLRATELCGARWEEFDLEKKQWRVPVHRMKKRREHIVPLSSQALETLEKIRLLSGDGVYLFPNQNRTGKVMTTNTLLFSFYRMGYKSRQTTHGVRGIASTALHELGWNHAWIEAQLSHSQQDAVAAAYNSAQYMHGRADMMQAWANYLDKMRCGNVVEFRAAA